MCRPRSQDKYVHVAEQYQNLSILKGHTNLLAGRTVAVNGTTYTPGKVLIATRSLPWTPRFRRCARPDTSTAPTLSVCLRYPSR
jgi:pyruvate/2-oxoglutarate dehydrogenase complex dihydrolipoamide dehydrogenase (E3) component